MKSIFKSWKTTIVGVVVVALKLLAIHGKIGVDDATILAGGVGLILSKDHDTTTEK